MLTILTFLLTRMNEMLIFIVLRLRLSSEALIILFEQKMSLFEYLLLRVFFLLKLTELKIMLFSLS